MLSIMKPFTKATLRYFELSEKENAKEWIMYEINSSKTITK